MNGGSSLLWVTNDSELFTTFVRCMYTYLQLGTGISCSHYVWEQNESMGRGI